RALHSPAPRRSSDLAGGVRQGVGHGGVRRGPQGARPAVLARRREAARARLPAARPVRAGAQGARPLVRGEPRLVGRVMRWLITGGRGMLAADLLHRIALTGGPGLARGGAEPDLRDARAVRDLVRAHRPRVVVDCAAWTAVVLAETREAGALEINGTAARTLAEVCERA